MSNAVLEVVLRRDRIIVVIALAILSALAWGYILWLAANMDMGGMDMTGFRMIPAGIGIMAPAVAPWHWSEFATVFAMWVVMMIGMMTPSTAPMVLIYARLGRQAVAGKAVRGDRREAAHGGCQRSGSTEGHTT
jgi:predicted metal-binding membrane protein